MKSGVFHISLIGIMIILSTPLVFAQTAEIIEEEITGIIVDEASQLVDKIVGDIDFTSDNFLNTNEDETDALKESGIDVLHDSFELALSVKELASDGVVFISPYELSPFLVTLIGFAFAGLFIFSLLKKVGKHILGLILVGGAIVMLFVFLGIQI